MVADDQQTANEDANLQLRDRLIVTLRLLFAFLGFSGLVTEVATLIATHRWQAGNFFSYFTVEANLLSVISLVAGSLAMTARQVSRRLDSFRGAVAFYMTTVILIFIVLLSGYPASELTAVPWDNTVLHYIMPTVLILDWILTPPATAVSYRSTLSWLALPLAYLIYSLIRGNIVGWYPYPFMDPARRGYQAVLITSVVLAGILAIVAFALIALSRWRTVTWLKTPSEPYPDSS